MKLPPAFGKFTDQFSFESWFAAYVCAYTKLGVFAKIESAAAIAPATAAATGAVAFAMPLVAPTGAALSQSRYARARMIWTARRSSVAGADEDGRYASGESKCAIARASTFLFA